MSAESNFGMQIWQKHHANITTISSNMWTHLVRAGKNKPAAVSGMRNKYDSYVECLMALQPTFGEAKRSINTAPVYQAKVSPIIPHSTLVNQNKLLLYRSLPKLANPISNPYEFKYFLFFWEWGHSEWGCLVLGTFIVPQADYVAESPYSRTPYLPSSVHSFPHSSNSWWSSTRDFAVSKEQHHKS